MLYRSVDSLRAAINDMQRAVALDSMNTAYNTTLGELYYTSVQVDKATAQFEKAIALEPFNTDALLKLAEIKLVLRDYSASIDLVNKALRQDPSLAQGYYLKGWVYMEKGDTTTAISSFRTAVEQDPANYRCFMQLGLLSSAQRDPLALQYFNTALELRSNSVEALYGKAMYAQEAGMDSLALECYARILELDSTNSLAHYNSGFVRMEYLRDLERAKKDFSEAIRLEPNYYQAWYNRGVAMERTSQLDSAAANYQVVLTIEPGFTEAARALERLSAKGVRIKMRIPPTQGGQR
jgi:tetratricopeptide (TPR) repeat protein